MKINKYTSRSVANDPRMMEIVNNKSKREVEFYAIYVVQCNFFPPDLYHGLYNGFNSVRGLKKYCAENGLALFKVCKPDGE
jgi:hypothetical protein